MGRLICCGVGYCPKMGWGEKRGGVRMMGIQRVILMAMGGGGPAKGKGMMILKQQQQRGKNNLKKLGSKEAGGVFWSLKRSTVCGGGGGSSLAWALSGLRSLTMIGDVVVGVVIVVLVVLLRSHCQRVIVGGRSRVGARGSSVRMLLWVVSEEGSPIFFLQHFPSVCGQGHCFLEKKKGSSKTAPKSARGWV